MKVFRVSVLLLAAVWSLTLLGVSAQGPHVDVLTVKGAINPVVANYIDRGINLAQSDGAVAVIIRLDTPGGLDTSMREIVQDILNANVPVIVYVWPPGARAASAGTFITLAANVAVMSPNTAIGAAHPVNIAAPGQGTPSPIDEKVVNDAAAYIRSIAAQRKRNVDWAEKAVRESVSADEQEALSTNIVDLVAPDLPSLLSQVNGHQVSLLGGNVTLNTQNVATVFVNMNFVEDFLFAISDPNIAYILLSLAMTGLFFELANPGSILPGIVGGICLLLALFALGTLPVNYAGVLLIVLAFVLFFAELFVTSHGMLAVGALASFTIGSLILFSGASVNPWLIAGMVLILSSFFIFAVGAIVRARRRRPVTGQEGLIGKKVTARTVLDPKGMVFTDGALWEAESQDGRIEEGEDAVVTGMVGLKLKVSRESGQKTGGK